MIFEHAHIAEKLDDLMGTLAEVNLSMPGHISAEGVVRSLGRPFIPDVIDGNKQVKEFTDTEINRMQGVTLPDVRTLLKVQDERAYHIGWALGGLYAACAAQPGSVLPKKSFLFSAQNGVAKYDFTDFAFEQELDQEMIVDLRFGVQGLYNYADALADCDVSLYCMPKTAGEKAVLQGMVHEMKLDISPITLMDVDTAASTEKLLNLGMASKADLVSVIDVNNFKPLQFESTMRNSSDLMAPHGSISSRATYLQEKAVDSIVH